MGTVDLGSIIRPCAYCCIGLPTADGLRLGSLEAAEAPGEIAI